ncbi:acyltransferase family protein [Streptomyces sp. 8N706]|uniref:acyltransferase family protein n=1 Tax=Streptomyces sp. 8N706 TaxID=3457416 RepID=UPI003FD5C8A5
MTDLRLRPLVPPLEPPRKPPCADGAPAAGQRAGGRLRTAVLRIEAATPADRDRAVDVLRVLAILGIVLGHWLVSAVTLRADGHLMGDSPLRHMPGFTPVSWLLQPLAIFFFVGGRVAAQGYAAAQSRGVRYGWWLAERLKRFLRPVTTLLAMWALVVAGLVAAGVAHETIRTLLKLVISPLWFLLVFAVLTAVTPLVHRVSARVAAVACGAVAALDAAHSASGGAGWVDTLRQLNVPLGWLVPFSLGVAWAAGGFGRRREAAALLVGGALATAGLILWCGYPASMVGVPGSTASNLDPLSLAAVTFGLAQCGGALLLCGPLRRMVGQPPEAGHRSSGSSGGPEVRAGAGAFAWAATALMNMSAITVFLWHQTAMLAVTVVALGIGDPLFGLHTPPDQPAWAAARLAWIPVFVMVLIALCAAFRDVGHRSRTRLIRHSGM